MSAKIHDRDRRRLPPNQQLVKGERWPLVGERGPREDDSPWIVTIAGCVEQEKKYSLEQLAAMPQTQRVWDIHCVTRWSKYDVSFTGVPLWTLLPDGLLTPEAKFMSFVARSANNHSTSLAISELRTIDPLVAMSAGGKPLPVEHGGPVRMVVPGKYFYKSVKWLERIECLAEDRLGFWEADAGYHNGADPWLEQRYMAPGISKHESARLIERRDFCELHLRSIDASHRDLSGLVARRALLRNANFRDSQLADADFSGANLSNAHFERAQLCGANFAEADIEGASFVGADLRGADLRVASMFGASFCEVSSDGLLTRTAKFDQATRIDPAKLDALTVDQRDFVARFVGSSD
jgi:DMSO/TMAO reductase YedYZ molybdopterin-dependent catalytic subunit